MPPSTEDDWQITPHGATLSEALYRSPELSSIGTGKDVLELGGGLGNQTVLMWRQNPRSLTTTEVTEARAATLRASLTLNGCGTKPSVVVADWLRVDVPTPDGKVDVVITNPPFAASGKFNRCVCRTTRYLRRVHGSELLHSRSRCGCVSVYLRKCVSVYLCVCVRWWSVAGGTSLT